MELTYRIKKVYTEINTEMDREIESNTDKYGIVDSGILKGQALINEMTSIAFEMVEHIENLEKEIEKQKVNISGMEKSISRLEDRVNSLTARMYTNEIEDRA